MFTTSEIHEKRKWDIREILNCWNGVKKEERAKAGVKILVRKKWAKAMDTWRAINEGII